MKKFCLCLSLLMGLMFTFESCDDSDPADEPKNGPRFEDFYFQNIRLTSAVAGASITHNETILERGFCWSSSTDTPTIDDSKTEDGGGSGTFKSDLTDLHAGTSYAVRLYATTASGTFYSEPLTMKTMPGIPAGTVTDIDGNVYEAVKIGEQVWMMENLKVTRFRNGEDISRIEDNNDWVFANSPAYCNFNNDESYTAIFGRLYNWYAVADERNIAPEGWHVATEGDWQTLLNFTGGFGDAALPLRHQGALYWGNGNVNSTNATGFTALPSGLRDNGNFTGFRAITLFWMGYPNGDFYSKGYMIFISGVFSADFPKTFGCSVRCVKDI
jgi:uncharacterized protein (TIGR02145 family)